MWWDRLRRNPVLLDFLERAGWSAGEVFFATLLAGGTATSVTDLPWAYAITISLSAAVASIILTAIQYLSRTTNLSFWPDTLVRLGKTFLASLAASIAAGGLFNLVTFDWETALNVAFVTTLAALGKSLLAREKAPAAATPPPATESMGEAPPAPPAPSPSTLSAVVYREAVTRR